MNDKLGTWRAAVNQTLGTLTAESVAAVRAARASAAGASGALEVSEARAEARRELLEGRETES